MQVRTTGYLQMVAKFQADSYAISKPVVQTASEVDHVRMSGVDDEAQRIASQGRRVCTVRSTRIRA